MPGPSAPAVVVHRRLATPLGEYVLAATDLALVGVWRDGQARFPSAERLGAPAPERHPVLDSACAQLLAYLAGDRQGFELALDPVGTPFQLAVWRHLRTIPRGRTTTYGAIARAIERPRAAQAVGAAVGANPLSIVVPCHRVLGKDGAITGYSGGLDMKRALLALEGAQGG